LTLNAKTLEPQSALVVSAQDRVSRAPVVKRFTAELQAQ
jgi:hypothetical protein